MGLAEAQVINVKAEAIEKQGAAEASVMQKKATAESEGITLKAEAMKLFDGVGREHEEFKLQLNKQKEVELESLRIQAQIAEQQAQLVGQSLKSARIDIVGGDTNFFDKIVGAIGNGKAVDRIVNNSQVLSSVKDSLMSIDTGELRDKLNRFTNQFGLDTEDVKNLSIAALIGRLMTLAENDGGIRSELETHVTIRAAKGSRGSIRRRTPTDIVQIVSSSS